MPDLDGVHYSRDELMRKVGRLDQVAGVRLVTLGDAVERGVRGARVPRGQRSSSSTSCSSIRASTSAAASRAGAPWRGPHAPASPAPGSYEPTGQGFLRSFGAGRGPCSTTCGLDHRLLAGRGYGRATGITTRRSRRRAVRVARPDLEPAGPALAGYGERWEGDECVLYADGEVARAHPSSVSSCSSGGEIEARIGESRYDDP